MSLRILYLAPRIPKAPFDGGSHSIHHQIDSLRKAGHHVTLCVTNTSRHFVSLDSVEDLFDEVVAVKVDTTVRAMPALRSIFSRGEPVRTSLPKAPYNVQRFISSELLARLVEHLNGSEPYDVIHVDYLVMAWYAIALRELLPDKTPPIVLRSHNIEYRILEHLSSDRSISLYKRVYYRFLSRQLMNYEIAVARSSDLVVTISGTDAEYYRVVSGNTPVTAILPGMNVPDMPLSVMDKGHRPRIGFLGSLEWAPNIEGVVWFVKEVLPLIADQLPDIEVHIAGRQPVAQILALNIVRNVIVHGQVDTAAGFLETIDVAISPVLSGSGVRIKILEGLAFGLPMGSTTLGAEGLSLKSGQHILLADSATDFADACLRLFRDPEFSREIGLEGRSHVQRYHSWSAATEDLVRAYESITSIR